MTNFGNYLKACVVTGLCFASIACSTTNSKEILKANPDQRLEQMMALYENVQAMGDGCHEIWRSNNATVDCQRILNELEKLYVEFPNHGRIILSNAIVNNDIGRLDNAQWLLDQLSLHQKANPEAAILRAEIAIKEGNLRFAEDLIERQILMVPDNASLRELMAAIAYLRNDHEGAVQALSIAGRLGAPGWRLSYHHGLLSEKQEEWDQACDFYRMSLNQKPDFQAALSRLLGLIDRPNCDDGAAFIP